MTVLVPRRHILKPRLPNLAAFRRLGDPTFNRLGIRGQPWGLGRAGGAAAWSPLNLSNLVLWLDASQITGLNDTDPVITWADLSGTGDDPTQAVAANRPIYRTGIVNGLPVVRFDGINDLLRVDLAVALTQPTTHFGVARVGADTTTNRFAFGGRDFAIRQVTYIITNTHNMFAGLVFTGPANAANTWFYFINIFDGASSETHISGALPIIGNPGAQAHGAYSIGNQFNGGFPWEDDIAEYGVINGLITADEIALLNPYMATKWGI